MKLFLRTRDRSEEFVKVYESKLEGPNRRGRPLGRWKDIGWRIT